MDFKAYLKRILLSPCIDLLFDGDRTLIDWYTENNNNKSNIKEKYNE